MSCNYFAKYNNIFNNKKKTTKHSLHTLPNKNILKYLSFYSLDCVGNRSTFAEIKESSLVEREIVELFSVAN